MPFQNQNFIHPVVVSAYWSRSKADWLLGFRADQSGVQLLGLTKRLPCAHGSHVQHGRSRSYMYLASCISHVGATVVSLARANLRRQSSARARCPFGCTNASQLSLGGKRSATPTSMFQHPKDPFFPKSFQIRICFVQNLLWMECHSNLFMRTLASWYVSNEHCHDIKQPPSSFICSPAHSMPHQAAGGRP